NGKPARRYRPARISGCDSTCAERECGSTASAFEPLTDAGSKTGSASREVSTGDERHRSCRRNQQFIQVNAMSIQQATADYEAWLHHEIGLIRPDVELKHQHMREGAFPFLRATFYRWAQVWPDACSELAAAPRILGIGDLHVENFGTWRDMEGRLV